MADPLTVPELWNVVAEKLSQEIVIGKIPPGSRLIESKLAERFGISRGPVREALRELERQGMVTSVSRRGTVVCSLTVKDAREIFDVREALEILAIRTLSRANVDGMCRVMGEHLRAIDEASDRRDWLEVLQRDIAFHRTLVNAADNSRLLAAWDDLSPQVAMLIGVAMAVDPDLTHKGTKGHHEDIVDALRQHDRDRAIRVLTSNLQTSVRTLQHCLRPALAR